MVEGYFGTHALPPFLQPSEDSVTPEVGYCLRRMWLEMVVRDSGRVPKAPGENLQPQTGSALPGSSPRSRVLWSINSDLDVLTCYLDQVQLCYRCWLFKLVHFLSRNSFGFEVILLYFMYKCCLILMVLLVVSANQSPHHRSYLSN